jgi:hypothetical protein
MKNFKNYFIISLVIFASSAIFFACSKHNEQIQETQNSSRIVGGDKVATICDIIGATVNNLGIAVVAAGSSATYSYTNNTGTATNITWTLAGGGATFIGGATTINSTGPVTVIFSSTFTSGTLSAEGSGGTAKTCNTMLNITVNGGSDCVCPNPVIRPVLAVSGGHPYWRLQLDNLQPGDTYTWSQLHAPFTSGTNSTYVIVNPTGPMYSGFTVYCEVKRVCSNGTIKKRKAFYTNYYGGTTTTGTKGFINIGGVCDSNIGSALE